MATFSCISYAKENTASISYTCEYSPKQYNNIYDVVKYNSYNRLKIIKNQILRYTRKHDVN